MSDRFRSRKLARNQQHVEEVFPMDLKEQAESHKRRERSACGECTGLFLVLSGVLLFAVNVLIRNGYLKNFDFNRVSQEPRTTKKWELPPSLASVSTEEQQKMISDVCDNRTVITPLRNESSTSEDVSWTICMTINAGFYDFFRNWYHHYKLLDLDLSMVLFAEDPIAYDLLSSAKFLNTENTAVVNAISTQAPSKPTAHLPPSSSSDASDEDEDALDEDDSDEDASNSLDALWSAWNEGVFDAHSAEYTKLISNRPTRLLQVLCSGHNVLYIDTDTVLKKSPLPTIDKNYMEGVDISIAIDEESTEYFAHTYDFCTGFIAIKATPQTIDFLSEWENRCMDDGRARNDQMAFNLAYEALWKNWEKSISHQITLEVLPFTLFPNGKQYFSLYNESQREEVILVHPNWIVTGANKKLNLMKYGLWNPES